MLTRKQLNFHTLFIHNASLDQIMHQVVKCTVKNVLSKTGLSLFLIFCATFHFDFCKYREINLLYKKLVLKSFMSIVKKI